MVSVSLRHRLGCHPPWHKCDIYSRNFATLKVLYKSVFSTKHQTLIFFYCVYKLLFLILIIGLGSVSPLGLRAVVHPIYPEEDRTRRLGILISLVLGDATVESTGQPVRQCAHVSPNLVPPLVDSQLQTTRF